MKRALLQSILLHALFFLSLVAHLFLGGAGGSGSSDEGTKNGKAGAPEETEVVIVPKSTEPQDAGEKCKNWYGGIGILVGYATDDRGYTVARIIEVAEGYPAYRAGLQSGDIILNDPNMKGDVGSVVTAEILRNGQRMSFTMTREKVCTDGKDQ